METIDSFIELVNGICRRRQMYVADGTFFEVCAYLSGYAAASRDCPLGGEGWSAFNEFVCAAFRFPSKYGWPYVLKQCSRDDDEAIAHLQRLLTDFAERTKTESLEEIVQDVVSRVRSHPESEPVKVWRRFSRAIHRGRKEDVEPLIQDHPDASVLWSGTCPDTVAPLLDQIAESYLVSVISGSEEDGEVIIITPDIGPVGVKRIGGIWRIDATKIIDCRKAD
jgi:hypothetical protein